MCFDRADGKLLWQRDVDLQGTGDHPPDQPVLLRLAGDRRRARDRQPRVGRPGLLRLRGQGALAVRRRQARAPLGQRLLADPLRRPVHPVVRPRRAAVPPRRQQEDRREGLGDARSRRRHRHHQQEVPRLLEHADHRPRRRPGPAHLRRARSSSRATTRRRARNCGRPSGPGTYCYSSPLFVDGLAIFGSRPGQARRHAATSARTGSSTGSAAMYISTAVIAGDYLYTYNDVGVPACYEWKTGKELWKDQIEERPGGTTAWGSPVHADGPHLHHRPATAPRPSSPPARSTSSCHQPPRRTHATPRSPSPAATSSSARTSTCGASKKVNPWRRPRRNEGALGGLEA